MTTDKHKLGEYQTSASYKAKKEAKMLKDVRVEIAGKMTTDTLAPITAEEYFQSRFGGKPSRRAWKEGTYLTPIFTVELMDGYAKQWHEAKMKEELIAFNK